MASSTEFNLADAVALLTRTPGTLNALLRGLPDIWVRCNEGRSNDGRSDQGKDTWSGFDIVGHLIVGERTDWMPRVRILLESGESRPFDPFDRFAQVKESARRVRPPASGKSSCAAGPEPTAGRLDPAREASGPGSGNAAGTSGDVDGSRPHSSASTIPRDGPPVS